MRIPSGSISGSRACKLPCSLSACCQMWFTDYGIEDLVGVSGMGGLCILILAFRHDRPRMKVPSREQNTGLRNFNCGITDFSAFLGRKTLKWSFPREKDTDHQTWTNSYLICYQTCLQQEDQRCR